MLRPATPLTVLLFCAFILLLLSVLSTPVIKGIPLARYQDTSFGIFGYCSDSKGCSGIKIGYSTDGLFSGSTSDGDFNLPSGARHSLFSLLIVHPIAAFFCLVMTILAAAAHFHSPSHSPRYLLALLILALPTLLITLLAFLVDVLLFIPHLAWGGWIVLGSVVLIVVSGIMLCAMRRTLVSRKARKRRIAENAEMSGENFYNRQREEDKLAAMPVITTESKTPLVLGGSGADGTSNGGTYFVGRPSEERQPLNTVHTPVSPVSDENNRYYTTPSRSSSRPRPNEMSPVPPPVPAPMPNESYGQNLPQNEQMPLRDNRSMNQPPNAYGRGRGYGPPRGRGGPPPGFRGGYGPPPRGGYRGPPGPPGGRGSFGPDMRGAYQGYGRGGSSMPPMIAGGAGAAIMAGAMNRRPPPEYPPPQQGNMPNATPYSQGATNYEPHSPSDYNETPRESTPYNAYDGPSRSAFGEKTLSPSTRWQEDELPRAETPPPDLGPIGNAIEMDATTGRASGYNADTVHDVVSLPRNGGPSGPRGNPVEAGYAPPRQEWASGSAMNAAPRMPSQNRARGTSNVSNNSRYYEDVDPRFAEPEPLPSVPVQQQQPPIRNLHPPHANMPGQNPDSRNSIPHTESFDNLPAGARSPAISEQSEFTSVSQRPVNPNWRPGYGGEFNQFGPAPSAKNDRSQVRQDMLLANNPDFELPGMGPRMGTGMRSSGRGGMRGSPMGMGGIQRVPLPPSALSMGGDGRYPEPAVPGGLTSREI